MGANATYTEVVTTTLENRSNTLADNVSKGNAILYKLKEKGGWKPATGRTIVQEVDYAENGNFQWYSGYETLSVAASDVLSAFEFNWKQAACAVVASGLEIDVQNTGREAVMDLFEARIKNAERTMRNNITIGMYATGTGNGGKEIGGLQLLVADDPTTGTVGGVSRVSYTFARNQVYDASTDGGTAATAANIQKYMNSMWLECTRGADQPDLILAGSGYYNLFWQSLQAIQRISDSKMANAGFRAISFAGADVVYEDSTGLADVNRMYFLNTDYLFLRYAPKRLFKPLPQVRSQNQDAVSVLNVFAGNLTCSNFSLQGVLKA